MLMSKLIVITNDLLIIIYWFHIDVNECQWFHLDVNECQWFHIDVNECEVNIGVCGDHECNNTIGSYACKCNEGFQNDNNDLRKCVVPEGKLVDSKMYLLSVSWTFVWHFY